MGVVCETREIIENDPAIPNHIQEEIIIPLLAKSRHFQVASSVLVPEHQLTVARAIKDGGGFQAVTSDRIIQELRLKSIALRDDSLRSRIELYRHNSINLHLIVTESHIFLSLPRTDGTPDLQNIIINKHPEAVEWAECSSSTSRAAGSWSTSERSGGAGHERALPCSAGLGRKAALIHPL